MDLLLEAFQRISQPICTDAGELVAPRPELLLVCGYSGIGKTSVIDEVHKPMVKVCNN